MEKTIKYLLQEAYVDGYKDAREAIAKEIESHMPHGPMCDITLALKQAVDIARGKK